MLQCSNHQQTAFLSEKLGLISRASIIPTRDDKQCLFPVPLSSVLPLQGTQIPFFSPPNSPVQEDQACCLQSTALQ